MQLRRLVPVLALLAAACGPKPAATPPPPAPPAGPTCTDAAASFTSLIVSDLDTPPTDAQRAAITDGLEASCVEDAWSSELIACVAAMPPAGDKGCDRLVTEAQGEGVIRRLGAVMAELGVGEREKAAEDKGYDDGATDDKEGGTGTRHRPTDDGASDPCEGGE